MSNTQYHRNGVDGQDFYSAIISWQENGKVYPSMLVTFEMDIQEKMIYTSCRVVSIDSPTTKWRGDKVAIAIQEFFEIMKITDVYKFMRARGF